MNELPVIRYAYQTIPSLVMFWGSCLVSCSVAFWGGSQPGSRRRSRMKPSRVTCHFGGGCTATLSGECRQVKVADAAVGWLSFSVATHVLEICFHSSTSMCNRLITTLRNGLLLLFWGDPHQEREKSEGRWFLGMWECNSLQIEEADEDVLCLPG